MAIESILNVGPIPVISLLGIASSAEGGRAKVILAYRGFKGLQAPKQRERERHVQTEMADREIISNRQLTWGAISGSEVRLTR